MKTVLESIVTQGDMSVLPDCIEQIASINELLPKNKKPFPNLRKFVAASGDSLREIVPFIAEKALLSEDLFPDGEFDLLKQGASQTLNFTSSQILSIIALGFFCGIPRQSSDFDLPYGPNFSNIYAMVHPVKVQKLLFILNYFSMMKSETSDRVITIH